MIRVSSPAPPRGPSVPAAVSTPHPPAGTPTPGAPQPSGEAPVSNPPAGTTVPVPPSATTSGLFEFTNAADREAVNLGHSALVGVAGLLLVWL